MTILTSTCLSALLTASTQRLSQFTTNSVRILVFSSLLLLSLGVAKAAVEPLTVNGSQILVGNQNKGLAGNSYFWSNTGWGAERFYNAGSVAWLKSDWKANIVRAAMGVEDPGAYLQDPAGNKARVKSIVDAAIANDMYVIIDWHSHHAEDYQAAAVEFFTEMAQTYGQNNNVIYEIYNEPLQVSWSNTIKPYAEAVIAAIRAVDPDNLIVVGTPTWSQDVDKAAADPITGYQNIAYTLHFYAGTHKQWLRDRAEQAMNAGIAIMVTEWGTVSATGDGAVDTAETQAWVNWMQQYNISHLNWSVNDKAEGASILKPGASSNGNWSTSDLTPSGIFVRDIVQAYNAGGNNGGGNNGGGNSGSCSVVAIPAKVEAEAFCQQNGTQTEATSDAGGGSNIAYIQNNDWAEYSINVGSAGRYSINARVASASTGGTLDILSNGVNVGSISVAGTGGWQAWQSKSVEVDLPAGEQTLRLNFIGGGNYLYNLNWVDITAVSGGNPGGGDNGGGNDGGGNNGGGNNGGGNNGGGVSCEFLIDNEWPSGFVGSVKVTNNGSSAVSGNWSVGFQFTDGSSFLSGWNANFTGSNPVTITPLSWNSTVQSGNSVSFGLQANKGAAGLPAPTPTVTGSICN